MSTVFSSLYRRRIPSGLLFVIHSINVCCLWDLLFAVILYSFFFSFAWFVCIRFGTFGFVVCHFLPIRTALTHRWLYCARTHVLRMRPSGGEIRSSKTCAALSFSLCVSVWLFCVCVKFAQTLTIVPRVALNWYTVVFCLFLSQNFLWKTSVVFTYYKI